MCWTACTEETGRPAAGLPGDLPEVQPHPLTEGEREARGTRGHAWGKPRHKAPPELLAGPESVGELSTVSLSLRSQASVFFGAPFPRGDHTGTLTPRLCKPGPHPPCDGGGGGRPGHGGPAWPLSLSDQAQTPGWSPGGPLSCTAGGQPPVLGRGEPPSLRGRRLQFKAWS